MSESPRRTRASLAVWGLVLAAIAVVWIGTLGGDFLLDDFGLSWFAKTDGSVDWGQVGRFFFPSHLTKDQFLRPLPILAGAVDIHFWGSNPFGYHLTNLLLHLVTALAVGLLAARLTVRAGLGPIVALVYGLYPGHVESVAWIIHRMVGMTALFIALTLLLHTRCRPLAWITALAGLACKEPAAIVPAAVFLFDVARRDTPWRARVIGAVRAALPYCAVIAVYVLWKWLAFGKLSTGYGKYASYGAYFFGEQVYREIPGSVLRFVFPMNEAVLQARWGIEGWTVTLVRVVLGAGFVVCAVRALRRRDTMRVAWFGLLLALGSLALVSPFLRVSPELTNSRHFSAPAIGLAMVLGAGVVTFRSTRMRAVAAVVFAVWALALPVNLIAFDAAGRLARGTRTGVAARIDAYPAGTHVFVAGVPSAVWGAPVFGDGSMLDAAIAPPFEPASAAGQSPRGIRLSSAVRTADADPDRVLLGLAGPLAVLEVDEQGVVREVTGPVDQWRVEAPTRGALVSPVGDASVRLTDDPPFSFRFPSVHDYYRVVFAVGPRRIGVTVSRATHLTERDGRFEYQLSRGDLASTASRLDAPEVRGVRGPITWWVEAVDDPRRVGSAVARTPAGRFVVRP